MHMHERVCDCVGHVSKNKSGLRCVCVCACVCVCVCVCASYVCILQRWVTSKNGEVCEGEGEGGLPNHMGEKIKVL